ncbi:transporter substrate-binding domain-containing protein [Marinitoga lauensis]|uniref:transporter substrate-binding domain-containing protein n=1 Tax=Marinitoga lauensis TaxID=2201189 RepID=UPI001012939A|nr:transporter substrate-binding domain-containing protein [Marinitoga lauensis]
MFSFISGRDLKEILDSGYLIIGIRNIPSETIYLPDSVGRPGFCYELAKIYADYLNVELKIHIVDSFVDYWTKNGEIVLKKEHAETPDIYGKVDVVADIITVTPERKKIVNMIPFIENAEILYARKDIEAQDFNDLKGKKIITGEAFNFYYSLIKN